ncbi:MAG: hypothetical protein IPH88_02915 [Bacteroidales bacterium]|nr:hypothetical protein [Bacteroidales bacterium]
MKKFVVILFYLVPLLSFCQINANEFDPLKWEPPYRLDFPAGWGVERFLIPISFAPQIPYKGVEDIRFTPGWGKAESTDYWSYAFLWYLDGYQKITAKIVEKNLKEYYTGLVDANQRESSDNKSVIVKTVIKRVNTQDGDLKTFYGSVYMLDYMTNKPITLYCKVHLKTCDGQNNTFIFYELSPKPYNDNVWQSLDILWAGFSCEKSLETK